eukprot:scaffold70187_cov60-Phaeocystis_antarctica.AAC.5
MSGRSPGHFWPRCVTAVCSCAYCASAETEPLSTQTRRVPCHGHSCSTTEPICSASSREGTTTSSWLGRPAFGLGLSCDIGTVGRASGQRHRLPLGPERLRCSSRVRSAAKSLESQPKEARVASGGATKTALRTCWPAVVQPVDTAFSPRWIGIIAAAWIGVATLKFSSSSREAITPRTCRSPNEISSPSSRHVGRAARSRSSDDVPLGGRAWSSRAAAVVRNIQSPLIIGGGLVWWGGTSSGRHWMPSRHNYGPVSPSADGSERTAASGQQRADSSPAAARPRPPPPHHPPRPPQLVGRPAWRCRATSRRLRPHAPLAPTPRLCGGRERRDGQKESHREIF